MIWTKQKMSTIYPPGLETVPNPFAIVKANEHLIIPIEYLICYNKGYSGKARDFMEMALRRKKKGLDTR